MGHRLTFTVCLAPVMLEAGWYAPSVVDLVIDTLKKRGPDARGGGGGKPNFARGAIVYEPGDCKPQDTGPVLEWGIGNRPLVLICFMRHT